LRGREGENGPAPKGEDYERMMTGGYEKKAMKGRTMLSTSWEVTE